MKKFRVERADYYVLYLEAEDKESLKKLLEEDDNYLNGGYFLESVFDEKSITEDENGG